MLVGEWSESNSEMCCLGEGISGLVLVVGISGWVSGVVSGGFGCGAGGRVSAKGRVPGG